MTWFFPGICSRWFFVSSCILFLFLLFPHHAAWAFGSVTIAWDPNPEENLAGYRIYLGTQPGEFTQRIDVGNITHYTVTQLSETLTYYFVVTAYDHSGGEGGPSNQVQYSVPQSGTSPPLRDSHESVLTHFLDFETFWGGSQGSGPLTQYYGRVVWNLCTPPKCVSPDSLAAQWITKDLIPNTGFQLGTQGNVSIYSWGGENADISFHRFIPFDFISATFSAGFVPLYLQSQSLRIEGWRSGNLMYVRTIPQLTALSQYVYLNFLNVDQVVFRPSSLTPSQAIYGFVVIDNIWLKSF